VTCVTLQGRVKSLAVSVQGNRVRLLKDRATDLSCEEIIDGMRDSREELGRGARWKGKGLEQDALGRKGRQQD